MHSVLRIEKKFSANALSYGFPRLDIDGVKPYDCVRLKYACECMARNVSLRKRDYNGRGIYVDTERRRWLIIKISVPLILRYALFSMSSAHRRNICKPEFRRNYLSGSRFSQPKDVYLYVFMRESSSMTLRSVFNEKNLPFSISLISFCSYSAM